MCAKRRLDAQRSAALRCAKGAGTRIRGAPSSCLSTQTNRAVGRPSDQEGAVDESLGLRQLQAVENREIKK